MDFGTSIVCLFMIKLLLYSVVSMPGAKFLGLDLIYFYLNTLMERPKFFRMKLSNFPDNVIEHYGLKAKVDKNSFVFVKCVCRMYGLPHTGIIAQELLE